MNERERFVTIKNRAGAASLTLTLLIAALSGSARAAADDADDDYGQALRGVLADAGNPEKSFDFVEAAIAAGDLRGATAALERILLIDPRLANIRLELGVLYLRMGNGALAQYHIREALRASNVPDTVRLRAERLLALAGAEGRRHTLRSEFSLGYRHDSNANAGPGANAVYVLDPFTLLPVLAPIGAGGKTSDAALDASMSVAHSFALRSERGSSWDTDLLAYAVRYSDLEALDQYSLGVETGPTWVFAGSADQPVSIRPLALAGKAFLDGDDYFDYSGMGLSFNGFWSAPTITQLRITYESRDFDDSPARFLSDRSGDYIGGQLRQVLQLGRWQLSAGVSGQKVDADADYQSFSQLNGIVGARFFGSAGAAQRPWNVYADLSYGQADYDAADLFVNPYVTRKDDRLEASAGLEFGLSRSLSVALDLRYTSVDSNLPNYEYDNFSAGIRAVVRM